VKQRLFRWWTYFRRGHSTYLTFLLSFANFIVIQYRLLIETMQFLEPLFPKLSYFVITFLLIYVPVSIVIGWLDYRKGSVPTASILATQANPWAKDISKALMLICEEKYDEAKYILKKWVDE